MSRVEIAPDRKRRCPAYRGADLAVVRTLAVQVKYVEYSLERYHKWSIQALLVRTICEGGLF